MHLSFCVFLTASASLQLITSPHVNVYHLFHAIEDLGDLYFSLEVMN